MEAPAISNVEYLFYAESQYSLMCFSLNRVLLQNSSLKLEGSGVVYGILQKSIGELVVANSEIELIGHASVSDSAQLTYHTRR